MNWPFAAGCAITAQALTRRFDANSYLSLLDAMDSHDLGRGRGVYESVLKQIRQPVLVGSVISDALYVPAEQQNLAFLLPQGELFEIDSEHGHDGFLIDAASFDGRIRRFVERLPASDVDASQKERIDVPSAPSAPNSRLKFAWQKGMPWVEYRELNRITEPLTR